MKRATSFNYLIWYYYGLFADRALHERSFTGLFAITGMKMLDDVDELLLIIDMAHASYPLMDSLICSFPHSRYTVFTIL